MWCYHREISLARLVIDAAKVKHLKICPPAEQHRLELNSKERQGRRLEAHGRTWVVDERSFEQLVLRFQSSNYLSF